MKFVRYNCGCVGIYPPLPSGKSIVFDYCAPDGHDARELGVSHIAIKEPDTHEEMEIGAVVEMFEKIRTLIGDGYKYREIRLLLEIPRR